MFPALRATRLAALAGNVRARFRSVFF